MRIPILGSPWCFYSDEAGGSSLKVRDRCFCFATIAIPGIHNEITDKLGSMRIGKKNTREKEIIETKNTLDKINSILSITYFDLSTSEANKNIRLRYENHKKTSNLSEKNQPSQNNYTWVITHAFSLFESVFDVFKDGQRINNAFVYYHVYPLKRHVRNILDKIFFEIFDNKVQEVCGKVNLHARCEFLKGQSFYQGSLTGLKEDYPQIKIVDQLSNAFRSYYLENKLAEFKSLFNGFKFIHEKTHIL